MREASAPVPAPDPRSLPELKVFSRLTAEHLNLWQQPMSHLQMENTEGKRFPWAKQPFLPFLPQPPEASAGTETSDLGATSFIGFKSSGARSAGTGCSWMGTPGPQL